MLKVLKTRSFRREFLYNGLMKISSLTKVREFRLKLYPKNFYKVKQFYEDVLGYQIVNSWDGEKNKGVMFDTGVAVLELLTPKKGYVGVKGSNVSLMVKDVWALWEKLKNHPNIVKSLNLRPWGDMSFGIVDPEGFKISFFTPNSQKPK